MRIPLRSILALWVVWVAALLIYQTMATMRYDPARPDQAVMWSANETGRTSQRDKIYLMEPFLNEHVSWDAEFYLSIAVAGYDDPAVRLVDVPSGQQFAMNYAFFPGYPMVVRVVSVPLSLLGMNPIATATLSGVIVSAVSTLAALFALYALVVDELDADGALRTGFYLLIFPTAFYLLAVFTEGLFLALALWCLVMLKRKQWLVAGALAAAATVTRATGLLLLIPFAVAWVQHLGWRNLFDLRCWVPREAALFVVGALLPVGAYLIWNATLGEPFHLVEDSWFGRSITDIQRTFDGWQNGINEFLNPAYPERRIYYLMEFSALGLAVTMALYTIRRYPGASLFSLAALTMGALSGAPQSLVRYVLTTPALFIGLGRLGHKSSTFDRGWTILSLLLLAMQLFLFAKDMWTA